MSDAGTWGSRGDRELLLPPIPESLSSHCVAALLEKAPLFELPTPQSATAQTWEWTNI